MLGWWVNQPSDPAYYIEDCPILKAFISVLFRVAAYQNDKKKLCKDYYYWAAMKKCTNWDQKSTRIYVS